MNRLAGKPPAAGDADWAYLRGRFVVVDGCEGAGKSTQTRMLVQLLEAAGLDDAVVVRDPGSTTIGEKIRSVLLDPAHGEMAMRAEMLLYMASRAQMVAEVIRPAVEAGRFVLCDRYVSSTLAYQLEGDGLTRDDILQVARVATGGVWPDLTVLLDMPVEQSQARVVPKYVPLFRDAGNLPAPDTDRIERRPLEYHRGVRGRFLAQASADPHRFAVVDAGRDESEVFEDMLAALRRLAPAKG